MELILLRHGETEWSVTGQHTGRTDVALTMHGRRQAAAAARTLERVLAQVVARRARPVVFSSPLERAMTTARIVFPVTTIRTNDDLREMDYGDYEGLTTKQIREFRPGWDIWLDGCPNGESVDDVGDRADHFLALAAAHEGPVVAVAHGHLSKILAARAVGLGATNGRIYDLDTAAVSLIVDGDRSGVVKLWNIPAALI